MQPKRKEKKLEREMSKSLYKYLYIPLKKKTLWMVVKDILRTETWILSEAAWGPLGFPEVSGQRLVDSPSPGPVLTVRLPPK